MRQEGDTSQLHRDNELEASQKERRFNRENSRSGDGAFQSSMAAAAPGHR